MKQNENSIGNGKLVQKKVLTDRIILKLRKMDNKCLGKQSHFNSFFQGNYSNNRLMERAEKFGRKLTSLDSSLPSDIKGSGSGSVLRFLVMSDLPL